MCGVIKFHLKIIPPYEDVCMCSIDVNMYSVDVYMLVLMCTCLV